MSSLQVYAYFEHPDGSWYRLWITHTVPKTQRGHPWHVHATYDKTGTLAPVADSPWYEQPYGIANWDCASEAEALSAFHDHVAERLARGYELIESAMPEMEG